MLFRKGRRKERGEMLKAEAVSMQLKWCGKRDEAAGTQERGIYAASTWITIWCP
jgi:hypothetical protein